jgi:hypothetical protein
MSSSYINNKIALRISLVLTCTFIECPVSTFSKITKLEKNVLHNVVYKTPKNIICSLLILLLIYL